MINNNNLTWRTYNEHGGYGLCVSLNQNSRICRRREREKEDVIIYQNSRIWFGEYVEEREREREVG